MDQRPAPSRPPVETCRTASLTRDEVAAMVRLHRLAWTSSESIDDQVRVLLMRYADPDTPQRSDPLLHRQFIAGELVATALSFRRTIAGAQGPFEVLALAGVATHPDHRGRGYGEAVVRAAFARLDARIQACFFQTGVPGFYRRLGARLADNPIVNRVDDERTFWEPHIMVWPSDAPWPSGEIDIRGAGW